MKYLSYAVYLGTSALISTFMLWGVNALGLWGETFITRFAWTVWDIFVFVICVNTVVCGAKLNDFSTNFFYGKPIEEVDAEGHPAPVSSDVLCWFYPLSITLSGWYWVKNNSGDRWITYVTPYSSDFDPNFGMDEDDRIQVAGPIPSPYN